MRSKGLYYVGETYTPREISVFDSSGVYVLSIGREGGGPGELRHVTDYFVLGDTLYGYDALNKRISRFRTDGSYLSGMIVPDYTPFAPRVGGIVALLRGVRGDGPATLEVRTPGDSLIQSFSISNESTATDEKMSARLRTPEKNRSGSCSAIATCWRNIHMTGAC